LRKSLYQGATPVPESDQKRILENHWKNIDHLPPNGISVRSRLLKICSFIEERHKAKDKILLVSTHGVLINNLVYYLFPDLKPPKEKLLEPKTSPGSLTLLRLNNRQYNLDCFGYTTS
jgi:broad specificity phosphatase PhoE